MPSQPVGPVASDTSFRDHDEPAAAFLLLLIGPALAWVSLEMSMPDECLRKSSRRCGAARLFSAAIVLVLWPVVAFAAPRPCEQAPAPPQQAPASPPQTPPQTPPPAKPPQAPLFPKHKRGLYKNGLGLWVLDATPQSPPLVTDDPGVPDKGTYEINLITDADASSQAKNLDLLDIDANYGVVPSFFGREVPTQIKFEFPISAAKENGQPYSTGVGEAEFGVKFKVYDSDRRGLAVSVYPQVGFGVGARFVADGLVDKGQTLIFPLLVSKEFTFFTLVLNAALNTPVNDPDRRTNGAVSAGLGFPVTRKFTAMIETRGVSRVDVMQSHTWVMNVGVMRALGQAVVLFANVGHTVVSGDGLSHTFLGAGIKILTKRDEK